jgi:predicted phage terminase large subunit-like protein
MIPVYRKIRRNGYPEYRCYIPTPLPVEMSRLYPLDISPYVLGVWLGDGHTDSGRITSADPEIFQWFDIGVNKTVSGEYLYQADGLTTKLRIMGILGDKLIPVCYLYAPISDRLALLQGLMDTDGTIHQDGKIGYFCNTNPNLIRDVVTLVRSLGGVADISEWQPPVGKLSWRVSVKLPGYTNPFRLTRKASKWIGCNELGLKIPIVSIEPIGKGLARCITVDAVDGTYITDDFLVTHNSTALTHDYGLAVALFREQQYIIILGATEEMAIEHLGDIASELRSNDDLIREFQIKGFLTDQKTDIVVECHDGYQFRLIARGGEQKIRGKKWKGARPGLILGDDIEDDEQVESKERRDKFYRWLMRAAKQALRDGGKIRLHGTILHEDAALSKVLRHPAWRCLKYRAHNSFSDFSNILWPEKFSEVRLRGIRQEFIDSGDAPGYSQEYLNDPFDHENAYLRRDDFVDMDEEDYISSKVTCAGWDFAISTKDYANRTSCTIGGKDVLNILSIIDQRVGRWAIDRTIDEMFIVQRAHNPVFHFVEKGQIWAAIEATIHKEMQKRNIWLNIVPIASSKDKSTRGRTFQRRHRARGMHFDKQAGWYSEYEAECLKFTGTGQAAIDDQFDSTSILCTGFENMPEIEKEDFDTDEEIDMIRQDPRQSLNRNLVTGY